MEVEEEAVKISEMKKRRSIEKLQKDLSETVIPAGEIEREDCSSSPTRRRVQAVGLNLHSQNAFVLLLLSLFCLNPTIN